LQPVNAATIGLVLGISRSRVVNLAADGVLPRAGRGLFDLPACVQSYVKHKLSLARAGDGTALSLVAERSRLTKIRADNAELESRRLAGELVPAVDIEAAWLAVAGIVRSRLLLIPSKTAARVVALKTPGEAQDLLRKELNAALTAIATTPAI
jgi:phage terminase Nu1 subunit (DNA packaging protein)